VKSVVIASFMVIGILFSAVERNIFAGEPKEKKEAVASSSVSGKVVETIDSGRYTYVRLENNGKEIWVAVYKVKVVVGENVSFKPGIEMVNFESKTLKRKFDKIIFSEGPIDPEKKVEEGKSK
jgi:hypothetical protein